MTSSSIIRAGASRLALGLSLTLIAVPALAQAPETQSATNPAPAEDAVNAQTGANNNPGTAVAGGAATAAPADTSGQVEEIVVTAQFREQNLQKTPLAITAVSGAMLEARSQTNIAQVANQAPSVTLKPQGPAFGPSLGANIRGVGQFDFNPALEPGVGLYVDDVYYATLTGSIFDLLDLERVEILRGPQGTLAGKNSIGGAVKLYSKKPTGSNTGYVSAAYGSRDRLDLRASGDFGIAENLNMRLSGVAKKQGGYIKQLDFACVNPAGSALNPTSVNGVAVTAIPSAGPTSGDCVIGKQGEVDYQAVRGLLRWEPTDAIDVTLIGDFTRDDRKVAGAVLVDRSFNGNRVSPNFNNPARDIDPFTPNTVPAAQRIPLDTRFLCGRYCNYSTFTAPADGSLPGAVGDGRSDFTGYGFSGQVNWKLADGLSLTSITAYRAYDLQFSNDDDLTPLAHSFGRGDLTFHSFSQELRLNGAFGSDDQVQYTIGGFYQDQRSVYATYQDLRYAGVTPFRGNDPVNADTKAVFAQVIWKPIDRLTFTGGIRYTDESKDYTYSRRTPTGAVHPTLGALDGVTGTYDGAQSDRIDYRANAQYEITPDIAVYGQYSTGFKGGGINPRPFFAQQVLPFGPETLESYELGLKSDLFDRRVRLNLAGFYSNYDDIQLSLSNCTSQAGVGFGVPCALIVNGGKARIQGFEVETSIRPVDGLIIEGSVSLTDFKYKSFSSFTAANGVTSSVGGPTAPNGPQFGDVPPYTPKWKWSVGAQYEIDAGSVGSFTPRLDAAFQDDIWSNATNRPSNKIEDYIVANGRLTWANVDKDLEISAEVTNIFDKYYYLTNFDLTIAGAGISSSQPGRPREWALTVKKKF